jgi:hypothetical protein
MAEHCLFEGLDLIRHALEVLDYSPKHRMSLGHEPMGFSHLLRQVVKVLHALKRLNRLLELTRSLTKVGLTLNLGEGTALMAVHWANGG